VSLVTFAKLDPTLLAASLASLPPIALAAPIAPPAFLARPETQAGAKISWSCSGVICPCSAITVLI